MRRFELSLPALPASDPLRPAPPPHLAGGSSGLGARAAMTRAQIRAPLTVR
jgi:hypothetical protein